MLEAVRLAILLFQSSMELPLPVCYMGSGTWTQVLMIAQQFFQSLTHLSNPHPPAHFKKERLRQEAFVQKFYSDIATKF